MADHERSSTKHRRTTHRGQLDRSEDHHLDSHKFENRSDRHDSYDYSHGSFRTAREERAPQQGYPQSDRGQHCQYDYASNHRYSEPEDRLSGSVMKDHRWNSHDRPKTINSRSHEGFNRADDTFYGRESSNGLRNTNRNTTNERRRIRGQERYDRKDEPEIVHEKRHQWDNEYRPESHDNYHKEDEQERQEAKKSPARYKDRDDLEEQEQYPYTADRRSERHQLRTSSSRGRPSSRGSSSRSLSSASDLADGSRDRDTPKEGSSFGRRLSLRDRRRSRSHSGSPRRSESRHLGIMSSSKNHSSVKKDSESSRSHKHSGKRKHRDRSGSPDDRKRRKHKEREREKDKEISREKEKMRKKDEERRSVLTGKKIKLKVKKDKGDHERDANRKDLLQFLNSAFE